VGERRRGREFALQMLFQLDVSGGTPAEVFPGFWELHEAPESAIEFAERLVRGVIAEREELDRWIGGAAEHWRLERMAVVDRNVLRIAIWELLHDRGTPAPVILDEAIEVGKKFGGGESGGFINGVLDTVRRRIEGGAGAPGSARPAAPDRTET
jgi:N utilization substance protein B